MSDRELLEFLAGPLSDAGGGSQAMRTTASRAAKDDCAGADDDDSAVTKVAPYSIVVRPSPPLFSYQDEIVGKLMRLVPAGGPAAAALVSLPTGGGKTRTGLWFFRETVAAGVFRRLLWVAPSIELVSQAVAAVQTLWGMRAGVGELRIRVGDLAGGSKQDGQASEAFFVTAQFAAGRLGEVRAIDADLVIFDEAHQASARTFSGVVRTALERPGGMVVGLSATPGRSLEDEGLDLARSFHGNLVTASELGSDPVGELVRRGVLSRLEVHEIPLPLQWEKLRVRGGQTRSLSVSELALNPQRFWAVVDAVSEMPRDAKVLVFAASVAHAYALGAAIRCREKRVGVVTHRTEPVRRARLLRAFEEGELDVLLNKTLLAVGYDCPAITDVVLATPIRSAILWEQIVGRGARGTAVGGGEVGRVWELDDHRTMHGRVLSYARFSDGGWA